MLNEEESVALRLLTETSPNLELVYGLVSDQSAKALEMIGSLELAKGNVEVAYHKLNNAFQVYHALDHKHKQVRCLWNLISRNFVTIIFLMSRNLGAKRPTVHIILIYRE